MLSVKLYLEVLKKPHKVYWDKDLPFTGVPYIISSEVQAAN